MDRREFLGLAAAGFVLAGAGELVSAEPAQAHTAAVYYKLPNHHSSHIAWTVDDGASAASVAGYIKMAKDHNIRLTFFATQFGGGWLQNKKALIPMVESGQIQMANHVTHHPNLTHLTSKGIHDELASCEAWLKKHFGVSGKPYFRPPYGIYDTKVLRVAADMGYTRCVMWEGSMGDAGHTSARGVRRNANKWMTGGRIFIAHANNMYAMNQPDYFVNLLKSRHLKTKTLHDVFG